MTKNNIAKLPNTKQLQFGNLNLQLRLDGKAIVSIEKRLDESLMGLFINGQGGMKLPPSNKLLIVLQGANQTSGVTDKAIIDAFELYLEDGKTPMDLFTEIQDLLETAGFFGKKEDIEKISGESLDAEILAEEEIL